MLTANAARTWNPDRMDPTRSSGLRRRMLADIRRRFKEVKRRLVEHVRDNDAFGLTGNLASTQVDLPSLLTTIQVMQRRIDPADVIELEDKPHVTVRYGLLTEEVAPVQARLSGIGSIQFRLDELGSFSSAEQDVLMIQVQGDDLARLNEALGELPNETRFKDYKPHVTVAYLKPGTAQKYLRLDNPMCGWSVETKAITFSDSERTKSKVTLNADPRFHFMATPEQLKAFQAWLKKLLQSEVLGRTEDDLWRKYAEEAFKNGAGRSFDDVRMSQLRQERPELFLPGKQDALRDFYEGSKQEFLKSAFGRPVGIEKLKVLASRTFTDLQGVTDALVPKLSRTLLDGLAAGSHSKTIAKDLADAMDWALPRAETVARTEISRAYVEGQLDALEAMGVENLGVMVEWSTAADSVVCPKCQPLEGVVLKLEEAHGMIPFHPNCFLSPDVLISVENGGVKRIVDVKIGDYVLTHKSRYRRVMELHKRSNATVNVAKITALVDGKKKRLALTFEHPVSIGGAWVEAECVKRGDFIDRLAWVDDHFELTQAEVVDVDVAEKVGARTYNFTVDGDESYVAEGFIVHNCRCAYVPANVGEDDKDQLGRKRKTTKGRIEAAFDEAGDDGKTISKARPRSVLTGNSMSVLRRRGFKLLTPLLPIRTKKEQN